MSTIRAAQTTIPQSAHGERLDDFVGAWLAQALARRLSRAAVRRLIMAGAVRVDGQATRRPALVLSCGQRIGARVRLSALDRAGRDVTCEIDARRILFEDAWLIAVDKPAGLAFHETADPARPSLVSALRRFLAARAQSSAEPYVAVHQRLDRETSGVALFAKHAGANAGLAEAFTARRVVKVYHALTVRPAHVPSGTWSVAGQLGLIGKGRGARMGTVGASGAWARTDFTVLARLRAALLIEARPRTGRKHQIRAQLAERGLGILGDARYAPQAGTRERVPRLMLHARRLELRHPVTGAALAIESPYPEDFRRTLAALRAARRRRT